MWRRKDGLTRITLKDSTADSIYARDKLGALHYRFLGVLFKYAGGIFRRAPYIPGILRRFGRFAYTEPRERSGLGFWLENSRETGESTHKRREKENLREKFRARSYKTNVMDYPVDFHSHTAGIEYMLHAPVQIKDGLRAVGEIINQTDRKGLVGIEAAIQIHKAGLIEETRVFPLGLTNVENVQVRQALFNIIPYCRPFLISLGLPPVHIPASVQLRPPRTGGSGTLIPRIPSIMSMMPLAYDLPIRQTSIDIESLPDSEKRTYLLEAEQRRGYPADECELIAIFKRVPVEMISKLHFIDDEKAIVYNISGGLDRSRTRIYEVMVVRDSSKQVHLVPHGTRNRAVGLN